MVELLPGVAYRCRHFHPLIQEAVRSAWLRDVERLNGDLLGEVMDSREFLFRAEKNALAAVRPVPTDLQHGNCFYCGASVKRGRGQVDHLHSLTEYPIDLSHNFVGVREQMQGQETPRMPHIDHLAKWSERNREMRMRSQQP